MREHLGMTSQPLQPRRGTTLDHAGVTGLLGEVSVDTTKNTVVVHDGVTPGGFPLAREGALPPTAVVGIGITAIHRLTQEEYDALVEPDFNTMYVIVPLGLEMETGEFTFTGNPMLTTFIP